MSQPLTLFVEQLPAGAPGSVQDRLVLPFDRREKARQRVTLASGREAGLKLPRGTILRGGDRLRAESGAVIEVVAASESVSTVVSSDLRELARAAYHLGNRHVALQVGSGWLRYLQDHVLDAMVEGLGLHVMHELRPFEPEAGAYDTKHSHGHAGAHAHAHAQGQGHAHAHGHHHGHDHSHDRDNVRAHAHAHVDHAHDDE